MSLKKVSAGCTINSRVLSGSMIQKECDEWARGKWRRWTWQTSSRMTQADFVVDQADHCCLLPQELVFYSPFSPCFFHFTELFSLLAPQCCLCSKIKYCQFDEAGRVVTYFFIFSRVNQASVNSLSRAISVWRILFSFHFTSTSLWQMTWYYGWIGSVYSDGALEGLQS